jgi:2-polyprenyl-3-methyl-5-hydroxy-6-metoxy-1,4-benzoquinol methylase
VETSFDYGCGKLRYCKALLKRTDTLAIVDSEIQLSRSQTLGESQTSIRDAIAGSNRIRAYNDQEFQELHQQFDRGFCINVLSVIPHYSVRRNVLNTIHSKLKRGGTCLFVTQYRNSDFDRMRRMPNARVWRDGFLIDSLRGFSFYAMITPDRLNSMIKKAGFDVQHSHLNEGSVYTFAVRP